MNLAQIIARLAQIDIEVRDATDAAKVDALATEKRDLLARKAELEGLETRKAAALAIQGGAGTPVASNTNLPGAPVEFRKDTVRDTAEYRNAFLKKLMGQPLTETEQRAYVTSDAGVAGAVIPTQTASMFFDKMVTLAPMLGEISLMRVAGNIRIAVENVRADAAQHTENAAVTPASDTFAYIDLAGYEYIKVQRVSATVSTMSVQGFETWLVNLLAEDIAEQIENAIINGNGSTAPKGIEYANTWTNASTGIDFGTGVTYDNLVDLIALLPARYDRNAKFLMNKAMFYQQIMKIKDAEGDPIVARDVTNAALMRILGYPVLISDKVAANTAYLGDYSKVVGNLAQDITVAANDSSAFTSNARDYRGVAIFDCDIALADAFVKLFT